MAEKLYIFCPKDIPFTRPGKKGKPLMEEVLVDEDAEIIEGEKPETKLIEVVRSFGFFLENFIVSHPMFDVRLGHTAYASGLRILDIALSIEEDDKGTWLEFFANDARMMKKALSAPPKPGKDDKKAASLSAADMREMGRYEQLQYRTFFDSVMHPRTSPPKVEVPEPAPEPPASPAAPAAEAALPAPPVEAADVAAN